MAHFNKHMSRGLEHLRSESWSRFFPRYSPRVVHRPAFVQPKDRVKWWTLAQKDEVRLIAGRKDYRVKDSGESVVTAIKLVDQRRNRVLLEEGPMNKKNQPFTQHNTTQTSVPASRPVAYSNLQLYLGDHPTTDDPATPVPTFATRLKHSTPRWVHNLRPDGTRYGGRFQYRRYAAAVTPANSVWDLSKPIPWPKYEKDKNEAKTTDNDTAADVVNRVTFKPWTDPVEYPDLGVYLSDPQEHDPIERLLWRELANPHAKHVHLARYLERKTLSVERLRELERAEVESGLWRNREEAHREARRLWDEERAVDASRRKRVVWREKDEEGKLFWNGKDQRMLEKIRKKEEGKRRKKERIEKRLERLVIGEGGKVIPRKEEVRSTGLARLEDA